MLAGSTSFLGLDQIATLHDGKLAKLEELACSGLVQEPSDTGQTAKFHIVVPLAGTFVYAEGNRRLFGGVNAAVFVQGNREYKALHPFGGDRSIVITPKIEHSELAARLIARKSDSESRRVDAPVQLAVHRLIWAAQADGEPLAVEERLIDLFGALGNSPPLPVTTSISSSLRAVDRAKAYLQDRIGEATSLIEVAEQAGVNPIYLTHLFRRFVGFTLHQYVIQLRLAAALERLPTSEDLTTLAFELGFSSHSHFTATFRSRYGCAPSKLRPEAVARPFRHRAGERVSRFPAQPLCVARGGGR